MFNEHHNHNYHEDYLTDLIHNRSLDFLDDITNMNKDK